MPLVRTDSNLLGNSALGTHLAVLVPTQVKKKLAVLTVDAFLTVLINSSP